MFRRALQSALTLGVLLATLSPVPAPAQFSQPKVTYQQFDWRIYHSPHFDIHYYEEEEAFLQQMVSYAESAYLKLSDDLGHELSSRVPIIYYKTHPEFAQTNITLSEIPEAVGAFAEPLQNRIVLPIDDPPDKVYKVLAHELVHIFEYDILFASNLGRAIRSNPPLWIMEGLASYLAEDEDSFDQMVIRDAVVNAIVPSIQQLSRLSFLTYRFGNAVFTFVESRWGKEGIRNFMFEYRKVLLTGNIPKAIKEAFGMEVNDFNREFQRYLRQRYLPSLLEKEEPSVYGREIGFRRPPGTFTFAPTVSPGGELISVLANKKGELDLWVVSSSDGEPIRNMTKGITNDWDYLVAEVFDGKRDTGWSPVDDRVAVFARKENRRLLLIFDSRTGKRLAKIRMPDDIALQASPSFSPDGQKIVFSGNRAGIFDIFSYNLATGEVINHTDDDFVDSNPVWSSDNTEIIYNRRINEFEKIFTVMATDPTRKSQLTFGESSDIMPAYSRDGATVYYSSDRGNGIFNLYTLDLRTATERQLTDVYTGVFAPVELDTLGDKKVVVFTSFFRGRYRLYRMELGPPVEETPIAQRDLRPVELQPFRPPIELTLDDSEKSPYKRRYQVEAPSLEVGVTDDGTFTGNSFLSLTDLLGDKRWIFGVASVSSFSQIDVYHVDLSHRTNIFYHAFQYEEFYYFPETNSSGFTDLNKEDARITGAEVGFQVPFNNHYSFETGVGYSDASFPVFATVSDPLSGFTFVDLVDQDLQSVNINAFFVGDSSRWQSYGPYHGQRYRIGTVYSVRTGGDAEDDIVEYQMDYRKYWKMSRRSSFAVRTFGVVSETSDDLFRRTYSVGGLNQIRGWDFQTFFGDRVFFQNFELRFPLIDELRLPFGRITSIRGVFFVDVGGAYYRGGEWYDWENEEFVYKLPDGSFTTDSCQVAPGQPQCATLSKWKFSDGGTLQNGVASFGVGLNFRLGPLDLHWTFARRTDFDEVESRWRSGFWIGHKF